MVAFYFLCLFLNSDKQIYGNGKIVEPVIHLIKLENQYVSILVVHTFEHISNTLYDF